jgi:hypothetical protein
MTGHRLFSIACRKGITLTSGQVTIKKRQYDQNQDSDKNQVTFLPWARCHDPGAAGFTAAPAGSEGGPAPGAGKSRPGRLARSFLQAFSDFFTDIIVPVAIRGWTLSPGRIVVRPDKLLCAFRARDLLHGSQGILSG